MGERFQIKLMSMLPDFICTTCQRHTTGTRANSAGNTSFFSSLLSTRGILHWPSGTKYGFDYLNCTEGPDHNTEANTAGPNCIFCPALNVFKCTACQWGRDWGGQTEVQDQLEGTWWLSGKETRKTTAWSTVNRDYQTKTSNCSCFRVMLC